MKKRNKKTLFQLLIAAAVIVGGIFGWNKFEGLQNELKETKEQFGIAMYNYEAENKRLLASLDEADSVRFEQSKELEVFKSEAPQTISYAAALESETNKLKVKADKLLDSLILTKENHEKELDSLKNWHNIVLNAKDTDAVYKMIYTAGLEEELERTSYLDVHNPWIDAQIVSERDELSADVTLRDTFTIFLDRNKFLFFPPNYKMSLYNGNPYLENATATLKKGEKGNKIMIEIPAEFKMDSTIVLDKRD